VPVAKVGAMKTSIVRILAASAIVLCSGYAEAALVRLSVEHREPFAGGVEWGAAGAYERLTGTASFEVDPSDPLNAVIVDLDDAPRNGRGLVEFSTPFFILKPVDLGRGNDKIFYTVNNRGNDALLNAKTAMDAASYDFALRAGYTIVDAGWEGDLVPSPTRLAAGLPIAKQLDGSAIVGRMRVEYSDRNIPSAGAFTLPLEGSAAFRSYAAADTNPAHAVFTVRPAPGAARTPIAADRWAFGRCATGRDSIAASASDICYFDGFKADRLYELVYAAKDPIVMGLGFATTRDFASFLRNAPRDAAGTANPLARPDGRPAVRRIYATGASQTGGYLRDFLYLGFNEDESHRKVFDGVIPTIVGTDRVFINVRFADPNVFSDQDVTHDFLQTSYPPFTYGAALDPISGIRDGLLKRPATDPLVFQIDSATEFWQLRASLNVVDAAGQAVPIPQNVRLYFNSSTAHGFTTSGLLTPPPGKVARCANPTPSATNDTLRAMLVAMDAWADRGTLPPPSNYPRLDDGTLVTLDEARRAFPRIPNVSAATVLNELELVDFGPAFGRMGGLLSLQPPVSGRRYPLLVPKPDADGLDVAGIRPMQVRVPLGTSTGWNVRTAEHGAPNLCGLTGSFVPFARTKAERQRLGDPRPSLEKRYPTDQAFVRAVETASKALVRDRFLLPEDAERFVAAAKALHLKSEATSR
jgi:Alpha/beta hydrolase domain